MNLRVLDTDTISLYQRGHAEIVRRIDAADPFELVITVLSVEEQLSGWQAFLRRTTQPEKIALIYDEMAKTTNFCGQQRILVFTVSAIARFEQLKALKLNVGLMDLRIAAIALDNTATLVTRNVRDFARVPNLTVENWADYSK